VDHLRAGILVLAVVGQGDREDLAAGALGRCRTTPGYFIVRREPMLQSIQRDLGVLFGHAALRHEVEDVGGPVLDGDVLDLRALERDELDDRGVQGGGLELGAVQPSM
jgi:hypothetical protein